MEYYGGPGTLGSEEVYMPEAAYPYKNKTEEREGRDALRRLVKSRQIMEMQKKRYPRTYRNTHK